MDAYDSYGKEKRKRTRKEPYRKWSDHEQQQLVTFLCENKPIEKPTAQEYYKRFLREINNDRGWSLVRCKVKNLRKNYIDAGILGNTMRADPSKNEDAIKEMITRMCPFFDQLVDIFGYKDFSSHSPVMETEEREYKFSVEDSNFLNSNDPFDAADDPFTGDDTIETEMQTSSSKGCNEEVSSRTALSEVLEVYKNLAKIKIERLDVELKLREKDQNLQIEKFKFEKEKFSQELQMKKDEFESREKLKILELQMKERIAIKELEMKERIEMEKLKIK